MSKGGIADTGDVTANSKRKADICVPTLQKCSSLSGLTFLTISGILALYPILVSLYNVVNNFSRRKRTKL